jgi:hypothetical protein
MVAALAHPAMPQAESRSNCRLNATVNGSLAAHVRQRPSGTSAYWMRSGKLQAE